MERLIIKAASSESAQGLFAALSRFRTTVVHSDGDWHVEVQLGRGEREIIEVLNAIERCITERQSGPAQIELSGREITMHPADGFGPPEPAA